MKQAEPSAEWCCNGVKTDDPTVDQHEPHCQYHYSNWGKSIQPPQNQPIEDIQWVGSCKGKKVHPVEEITQSVSN